MKGRLKNVGAFFRKVVLKCNFVIPIILWELYNKTFNKVYNKKQNHSLETNLMMDLVPFRNAPLSAVCTFWGGIVMRSWLANHKGICGKHKKKHKTKQFLKMKDQIRNYNNITGSEDKTCAECLKFFHLKLKTRQIFQQWTECPVHSTSICAVFFWT